jgi:hypothetical protein
MLSIMSKARAGVPARGTPLLPKREWPCTVFARAALNHASDPCRHTMERTPPASGCRHAALGPSAGMGGSPPCRGASSRG